MNLLPSSKPVVLLDEVLGVAEESNSSEQFDSAGSGAETPHSKRTSIVPQSSTDATHAQGLAADLIEYEWPSSSGEFYFIQEQLAELLAVKSFKRKYPNIKRRQLEQGERPYLISELKIRDLIPSHLLNDLTALYADDVHELLSKEYPDFYEEFQKACLGRRQQQLIKLHTEPAKEPVLMDSSKIAELRKAAIKNAFEYNKEYQQIRKTERRYFYDSQTSIIQCPQRGKRKVKFAEPTPENSYPVALNPYQYGNYYKVFKPDELRRLPLNTITDTDHLFPPRREQSPPAIRVTDEELARQERMVAASERIKHEPTTNETPKSARVMPSRRSERNPARICATCRASDEGDSALDRLLKCCQCQTYTHARCAEMTLEMARIVRTYNWCCIDCKTCTICHKPDEEASMMCCDSCDRGYHTFCVGLHQPPTGSWQCSTFCKGRQQRQ